MCPEESLSGSFFVAAITWLSFKTRKGGWEGFFHHGLIEVLRVFLKLPLQARLDALHYIIALVLVSSLLPRSRMRLVSNKVQQFCEREIVALGSFNPKVSSFYGLCSCIGKINNQQNRHRH